MRALGAELSGLRSRPQGLCPLIHAGGRKKASPIIAPFTATDGHHGYWTATLAKMRFRKGVHKHQAHDRSRGLVPPVTQLAEPSATSAATVEATSCRAVKSTARCTVKSAAMEATRWTACKTASTVGCVSVVAVTVAPASSAIAPSTPAPISVIPRPGANEHSTRKPAWPVIAVRRTRVGCIAVIAIRACRRSGNVSWPDSHTHTNPDLRLREG